MALCAIHFILSKREDLLVLVESVIIQHFNQLMHMTTGILKCRLCLFFYFFAEHLFHMNEEYFQGFLQFLIQSLSNDNERAVTIQASETLAYLVQEEDVMMRIDAQMQNIFPSLINCIS